MNEQEAFDFSGLLLKYLRMELSSEEEREFLKSVDADPEKQELLDYYKYTTVPKSRLRYMESLDTQDAWEKVSARAFPVQDDVKHPRNWRWLRYVAILVVATAASVLWYGTGRDPGVINENSYGFKNDVLPGGNKAALELPGGETISLDDTEQTSGTDGQAAFHSNKGEIRFSGLAARSSSSFTVIRVPGSGQYKVVLPDGTKVWVNSLSALKFPAQFGKKERRVFLEGEAFFDVAKDAKRPFYVEAGTETVKVLGTRLNVSAYSGEIRTTLVDGSVKVSGARTEEMLEPGEQAVCKSSEITVLPVNTGKVSAWKNGYFMFDQDNIETIMDQLSRWYQVKVHYNGKMLPELYSGSMPRNSTLGAVLQMLSDVSSLQFDINGRDITVINGKQEK